MADTVVARMLQIAAIDVAACKALATIDELLAWARDHVGGAAPT